MKPRSPSHKCPFRLAAPLALGLALWASAGHAETDLIQATSPDGRNVALVTTHQSATVVEGDATYRLQLPSGVWVNRISTLADGWAVGGTHGRPEGRELFLMTLQEDVPIAVPVPPNPDGAIRHGAVPLVENGKLIGVAWLEGRDLNALSVRAAGLSGSEWNGAESVSPAGKGAQVALHGTVLSNGRWLLIWSKENSEKTDTMWSIRSADGAWTPPRRIHAENDTHDIAPALIPTASGALAAWSRFDGSDYRMVIYRFDGSRWRDTGYEGVAGTLYPSFAFGEGQSRLLYRSVLPSGWEIVDLAASGIPIRRAFLPRAERIPPQVGTGGDATWRWPEATGTAAAGEFAVDWEELD